MKTHGERSGLRRLLCIVLAIVVLSALPVVGQEVAVGRATADVLAGLTVLAVQDLEFGSVLQGVAKSQPRDDDVNSGIFSIGGEIAAGITISLTLPDYIALADGSDRMTIAFSTTDLAIDQNGASPSTVGPGDGFIDEDPHAIPGGVVIGAGGITRVYLGGRVTPTVDQTAGAYFGDIVCSVAYNGT